MSGRVLAAVVRVSRRNGRKGSKFMSPTEQRETIQGYADAEGDTVAYWFDETDSVSGKTTDREGLQAAMALALAGKVDGIAVAKVDRFSRNATAGQIAVGRLRKAGKDFIAVKDGIDGESASTPTGRLLLGFLFLVAEWQLETLTEGWEAVTERAVANGKVGNPKYGYRKDETQRLVPDPDKAQWIVPIFEKRAVRWSWTRIAEWLRSEGAPGRWGVSSVKQIVESRQYLGEVHNGKHVKVDAHVALVPVDLWERANSVTTTRGRTKAESYLLTSLVRCAECGVGMVGCVNRSKYGTYRYYRCRSNHGSWGKCPAPVRIRAEVAEDYVEKLFRSTYLTEGKDLEDMGDSGEVEAALTELADAETALESFLSAPSTEDMRRTLGDEWVDKGTRARVERITSARERLTEARNAQLGVSFPSTLAAAWSDDRLTVEEKRRFLQAGVAVVGIGHDGRVRVWMRHDADVPSDLPAQNRFTGFRQIAVDDAEVVAGIPAA